MPPPSPCVVSQLRQLVYYHLDNNFLQNALFFAERLFAIDPSRTESSYLLSLCHLRLGDNASAYEYSKVVGSKGSQLGCAYIFAQACLALQRYQAGIFAMEKSKVLWSSKSNFGKHTSTSRQLLPDAAAANCLLGKLYSGYDDKIKAIRCFEESLKLNPFMWDAFTGLCDMGIPMRVENIFRMNPEMEAILKNGHSDMAESQSASSKESLVSILPDQEKPRPTTRPASVVSDTPDPFNTSSSRSFASGLFGTLGISQKLNESNPSLTNLPAAGGGGIGPEAMETPTGPSAIHDATQSRRDPGLVSAYSTEAPPAPARKSRTIQGLGMDFSVDAPKMSRGITSKRSQKLPMPRAVPYEEHVDESAAAQALRNSNSIPQTTGERKRTVSGQVVPRQGSEDPGAPQRRSVRLFNQIRPTSTKSANNVPTVGLPGGRELKKTRQPISKIMRPQSSASTVGRQVSGNRKPVEEPMDVDFKEGSSRPWYGTVTSIQPTKVEPESAKQEAALRYLLELFRTFGSGYFALSKFECANALNLYGQLPDKHLNTPWVLAQMGRAYFEQASYAEAEKYYKRIRTIAPTRFEDMEIYSTILWHLKRETDLAFLAHELIDSSWQSPQAWCALGNSWSLARDHEQALRSFKRASQLDSKFAYGFTLQGHEHVANEEYDKALASYRSGMTADKRHYNAWYGMGRVYEKLGNYDKAYFHFENASRINPTNAVLICCIGSVLERQGNRRAALDYFTKATDLAPRSTLTRYKKSRTLMALGEFDSALAELTVLKDMAPDEAMVHFLLGRLYKSMRNRRAAVRHFTIALNLDPKASQQIKEAIESLEEDDEDYENSMTA